jgi:hypothetical protein
MKAKSEDYRRRWRASFISERIDAAVVAARFLAEHYGNPDDDLIDLVYLPEEDRFARLRREGLGPSLDGPQLLAEINEFQKKNRGLPPFAMDCLAYHLCKGMCHWFHKEEGGGRQ